jgi:predicted RNA-binding Zn-ribbon protein involved in translation (DUF1610 family)
MSQTTKISCPECGAEMNNHAMKVDYNIEDPALIDSVFGGALMAAYCCPKCGHTELIPV